MDCLPQPGIGHSQRDRLGNQPGRQRGVLDFLRADPVARSFDHRIAPPGEMEQPPGIAPHPVARPYRRAAIPRPRGRRTEAFGGALGIFPIPLRDQRAGMDQLTILV